MSKYGIFIIESLRSKDYFDGETLSDILKLSKIPVKYTWADTKDDLITHIAAFKKSKYRYLHLSCHADETGIEINGEDISNSQIQVILRHAIINRRLFMSACKGANRDLASKIVAGNGAYSLIGPPVNLYFDKSAMFWPAFYHVINEIDNAKMNKKNIRDALQRCVDLFKVPINYYSRSNGNNKLLWRLKIRYNGRSDNRQIKIFGR